MSWKITNRKSVIILVGITLLLTALNSWLSMFPTDLGYVSESPLGVYRFRLVTYDYGLEESVYVINEFGGLYEGILVALGKDFVYRSGRYEYPLRRDTRGFFFYLALLAINLALLVVSLILIPKYIKATKWFSENI